MSTTIEQTGIPTGTWNADSVHSGLSFEVPYAVATFGGDVTDFNVSLKDGVLEGAARVASLRVKDENLTAHLQSPEFFDGERHPELNFVSTAIRRDCAARWTRCSIPPSPPRVIPPAPSAAPLPAWKRTDEPALREAPLRLHQRSRRRSPARVRAR